MPANPPFGQDPMDKYSVPTEVRRSELAQFFTMPRRATAEKPGRDLTVMWDAQYPLVPGFDNLYSYLVRFTATGNFAGNHYHLLKHEMMYIVQGTLTYVLEDIETKQREEHTFSADDNVFVYVKPPIAHAVVSQSNDGILLVIGSAPGTKADEYLYDVVTKAPAGPAKS